MPGVVDYLSTEISTSKQKKFPLVTFVDSPGLGDQKYAPTPLLCDPIYPSCHKLRGVYLKNNFKKSIEKQIQTGH